MRGSIVLLGVAFCGIASADIIVPNHLAGVEGDGVFSLTSSGTTGRTFQLTIAASQLTGAVGQNIVGMRHRINGGGAGWPPVNVSFATWNVFMGAGVAPNLMSNTFAANFSGGPTQVRSGGIGFTALSFPSGGTPNAFGPAIGFDTPYLYTGGDLTIETRFSQQIGSTTQSPFDAVLASGGPANGWGVNFSARWTGNIAGTVGGNANFLVTELVTAPVPEPASMVALGLGALALMRRRRKSA
jgi:hypothetical protein